MPFRSIAQQRYLFSQKPEVAKKFAEHTPKSDYNALPMHKTDKKEENPEKEEEEMDEPERKHPEAARIHESKGMKNRFHEYNEKHRRKKNG